jgi:hypothetical protein
MEKLQTVVWPWATKIVADCCQKKNKIHFGIHKTLLDCRKTRGFKVMDLKKRHKNKCVVFKEKMFTMFQTLDCSSSLIFKNVLPHCLTNIASVKCNFFL